MSEQPTSRITAVLTERCGICDGRFDARNPRLTYAPGWTHPECRKAERVAEGRPLPGDVPKGSACQVCGGPTGYIVSPSAHQPTHPECRTPRSDG